MNTEVVKYEKMWNIPEYRLVSPGELLASQFLAQAKPRKGSHVIDFGCGTGRGALMLAILGGLKITMVDFAKNCLDEELEQMLTTQAHVLDFVEADLENPIPVTAEYGYCTDVMEHIPPDKVDIVLNNVLRAAKHVFFSIHTEQDRCGKMIGEELHLTVHNYSWWLQRFTDRGCVIHFSQELESACIFYVSAWMEGNEIVKAGVLNTAEEDIKDNVRYNCAQGWNQVSPHELNKEECIIIGGGPTLNDFLDDIKIKRANGAKLITLNGAYNWAIENGLNPSAQILVDARAFNARFVRPLHDTCVYLIASQCHPSVFEGLPRDRTFIWHTSAAMIEGILKENYEQWWPIPGGSTALLRAIPLMRMLGYKKFYLYGCDSCIATDNKHHAYAQPENDSELIAPVIVSTPNSGGDRIFSCHYWMVSQAEEFISLIKVLGEEIELEIFGDGLLKYILDVGAEAQDIESIKEVA